MVNKSMTKLSEEELNYISGGDVKWDRVKTGFEVGFLFPPGLGFIGLVFLSDCGDIIKDGTVGGYAAGRVVHLGALVAVVHGLAKLICKKKCKSKK